MYRLCVFNNFILIYIKKKKKKQISTSSQFSIDKCSLFGHKKKQTNKMYLREANKNQLNMHVISSDYGTINSTILYTNIL